MGTSFTFTGTLQQNDVEAPICEAPTFDPPAGEIVSGNVTLSSATSGAGFIYTKDGSEPTDTNGILSDTVPISEDVTVRAIAIKSGYNNSTVASAVYTISNLIAEYKLNGEREISQIVIAGNLPVVSAINNHYFIIYDAAGSVGVWFNFNGTGTVPAGALAADRQIEVPVLLLDTLDDVADTLASELTTDGAWTAANVSGTVTVTDAVAGTRTDIADGDTGFGFSVTQQGINGLLDSSIWARNLTNNGDVDFVAGHVGNSAIFNGANSLSSAGGQLDAGGAMSMALWFYPTDVGNGLLVYGTDDTSHSIFLSLSADSLYFLVNDGSVGVGVGVPTLNTWNFLGVRLDNDGNLNTRLNDSAEALTTSVTRPSTSGYSLQVGTSGQGFALAGTMIDQLRIWNVDIGQSAMDAQYNGGVGV